MSQAAITLSSLKLSRQLGKHPLWDDLGTSQVDRSAHENGRLIFVECSPDTGWVLLGLLLTGESHTHTHTLPVCSSTQKVLSVLGGK